MQIILRIPKDQAAYVYQLLESYDGIATYSTLPSERTFPYRDISITPAPDLVSEVKLLVRNIRAEVPVEVIAGADILDT